MQFFYIDYVNDGKKERNIGFLRIENDGISVGLRGVPVQCGNKCKVYIVNIHGDSSLLGEINIKKGYGMEKFNWSPEVCFEECMRVEIPLYGTRKGVCVLRDKALKAISEDTGTLPPNKQNICENEMAEKKEDKKEDIYEPIHEDKWQQLLSIYPQVHICPEAQSILIRPKDVVILNSKYHELAANSFVLHAYYNYRQLLLFRYGYEYYLGVPGVYYEREQRIAQLFGFEGFENGEARMQQDSDKKVYRGCFGYYMKCVEI